MTTLPSSGYVPSDYAAFVQTGFLGMFNAIFTDLGDMNQSLEVAFETGKSAELGQAGDDALDQLTDLEFIDLALPWIVLQGADG